MTRRSPVREAVSPRRRILPVSVYSVLAVAAVAIAAAAPTASASPAPGAWAGPSAAPCEMRAPSSAAIWLPALWHAPAFHAPLRVAAARLAAGEHSTGEQSTGEQSTGEQSTGEQSTGEHSPNDARAITTIDWRILAGLDYLTGKTTDTLKKIEGQEVRIPGFVVPLDDFMEDGAEFLLVPYYGACVHTPPPPPNQIIFVEMAGKKSVKLTLFDAVWMYGKLKIATVESPYGTVGFTLEGTKMEPYSSK